jgi:hypothetical protein
MRRGNGEEKEHLVFVSFVLATALIASGVTGDTTPVDPIESDHWAEPRITTMGIDDDSVTDRVGLVTRDSWNLRGQYGDSTHFMYGNPGDFPFVGDWDCDGDETPGLYRQSDGFVYLRNSNTQGIANIRFFFGNPGDIPLAGDFNGDGCDTVSIYRPSEGRVFIINALGVNDGSLGAANFSYFFGNPDDKPFVGDFDGDGIDTHRLAPGVDRVRLLPPNPHPGDSRQPVQSHPRCGRPPGHDLHAAGWTRCVSGSDGDQGMNLLACSTG